MGECVDASGGVCYREWGSESVDGSGGVCGL